MEDATMTRNRQITGPRAVREALGLVQGDKIQFFPRWHGYRLVVLEGDIRSISGVMKVRRNRPVSITGMNPPVSRMGRLSGEQAAAESQRRTRRA